MSSAADHDEFLAFIDAALSEESGIVIGAIEADHELAIDFDAARKLVSDSFRADMRSILTDEGIASYQRDPAFQQYVLHPHYSKEHANGPL